MRKQFSVFLCLFLVPLNFRASATAAEPAIQPAGEFLEHVKANFPAWDSNHDGELSVNEIELAVHDPHTIGPSAAAAAALRRAVRADPSIAPLTLDQIRQHVEAATKFGSASRFEPMYNSALKKINDADRTLFVAGSPKLRTLAQGRLGDCFLLASLGSLVEKDPARLTTILKAGADNTISVQYPNRPQFTIPLPTDGEIAIGATTHNDGLWANAFEDAVGKILLDRQKKPVHVTPYSIIGVGGSPYTVMEIITGHKVARLSCAGFQGKDQYTTNRSAKLDELREKLLATQSAGRLIVGGTAGRGGPQVKVPGIYYDHSYAVLKYDRATDRVSFWNPMGNGFAPKGEPGLQNGYATTGGRFEVPLTGAVQWFGAFSLESDEALSAPPAE